MENVLITGGSRGIGRAMVELFSSAGYSVAFTYKDSVDEALALADRTHALAIRADSAREEDILRAVSSVREALGPVSVLINNAAVCHFSLLTDMTLATWNDLLSVNLTAAFLYSKAVIPDMVSKKQGRIINISSMWGQTGASCEVAYSTAKAGLIGMTKALAKELGPSGITVNAIAPGVILTDMNKSLDEQTLASLAEESALMRNGTPVEVGQCALYLASEGAGFVTGQVIGVNGGYYI